MKSVYFLLILFFFQSNAQEVVVFESKEGG